jgi:predicted RNA polymerase sigma factor
LAAVDHVDDDVLRLMFVCCHPVLTPEAQCTLTLKLIGGLSTREIARAYLTTEATVAQRIVRAKRTLGETGAALEEPSEAERAQRLTTVLGVIYLLFNEGYSATAGSEWVRPALCDEALRLGRILTALVPRNSEVHGLTALMELQSSRLAARVAEDGSPILLLDQDRSQWDPVHIMRGLSALDRAERLASELGPYALQAAIAACHARAETAETTDWLRIADLYERLARVTGSPVVEVNRAVALGMAYGPEAGLALLDQLDGLPALRAYHLLPSVRGDLLDKLGRRDEARAEFARAATLTQNERERALLLNRASGRSAEEGAP